MAEVSDTLQFLSTLAQMSEMVTSLEANNQNVRLRELEIKAQESKESQRFLELQKQNAIQQKNFQMNFNKSLQSIWSPEVLSEDPDNPGFLTPNEGVTFEDTNAYMSQSATTQLELNSKILAENMWLMRDGEQPGDDSVSRRIADYHLFHSKGQIYAPSNGTILEEKYLMTDHLFSGIDESAGYLSANDTQQLEEYLLSQLPDIGDTLTDDMAGFLKTMGFIKPDEVFGQTAGAIATGDNVTKVDIMDRVKAFNQGISEKTSGYFPDELSYDEKHMDLLTAQAELANTLIDRPELKQKSAEYKILVEEMQLILPQIDADGKSITIFDGKAYNTLDSSKIRKLKTKDIGGIKNGGAIYYQYIKAVQSGPTSAIDTYSLDVKPDGKVRKGSALDQLGKVLAANGQQSAYNGLVTAIQHKRAIDGSVKGASTFIKGMNLDAQAKMDNRERMLTLTEGDFKIGTETKSLSDWMLYGDAAQSNAARREFNKKAKIMELDTQSVSAFLQIYQANRALDNF